MSVFEGKPAIIIDRRLGTQESPFIPIDETLVVNTDGKVILSEIPDSFQKVIVKGDNKTWCEIQEGIPADNQFKVDYINKVVTFNSSNVGKQLNFKYMGTGNHYYSVHSIYTEENNGIVTETLKQLTDSTKLARDSANETADNLVHKGEYNNATQYKKRNIVTYQGSSYMAIQDTQGNSPTNQTYWKRLTFFNWKGTYSSSTTYNYGDFVADTNNYNIYMSLTNNNTGNSLSNTSYWTKIINAQTVIDNIITATNNANTATTNANNAATSATNAANSANTAATNANNQANYAKTQGDYAKVQGDYANVQGKLIDDLRTLGTYNPTTTYKKNNIVRYDGSSYIAKQTTVGNPPTDTTYWELLAQRGTVNSVNNKQSDVNGNITLIAADIGAETPSGAQTKANQAEQNAKNYLDNQKGQPNGVASLDGNGKVPPSQLPTATTTTQGAMSISDKAKLDGIQAGAEVNQNAFTNIRVGATTITANSKTDTLELAAGANITLTPDTTNDKVTIAVTGVAQSSHTHDFTALTNKPTTLSGYGITDAIPSSDVVTTPMANKILKLDTNGKLPTSITGNADGNAATASKLQTARTILLTGDVTGSTSFDGSANTSINATLANSGVTAGTYAKVTVDSKGRVTAGSSLSASDIPNLDWSKITTGKPTTLSGYGIVDAIRNAGNTPSIQSGVDASKPSAGTAGRIYIATDTKKIYRDNGTSWDVIGGSDTIDWSSISNKPTTFTPSSHTHNWSEINNKPTTLAGYGITDAVKLFWLVKNGNSTSYVKIAELTTNIGAGENGLILYVNGVADYGTNMPGVDVLQVSTRGSVNLKVYRLIPSGSDDITYGYVNNTTTGKTEIWLKRDAYNGDVNIIVAKAVEATYGNLLTQSTEPAGIVYVTKESLVQLNNTTNSTSTTEAATANAVKQANDNANNRVAKSGDAMTGRLEFGAGQDIAPDGVSGAAPSKGIRFVADSDVFDLFLRTDNVGEKSGLILALGDNVDDYFQIEQVSPLSEATPTKLFKISEAEGANVYTALKVNGNVVWHAGNDGAGSGLDADTVDGKHLSDIQADAQARATQAETNAKAYTDQQLAAHLADNVKHIMAAERVAWNSAEANAKAYTDSAPEEMQRNLGIFNVYKSGKDSNGVFTTVEYKRANGTLYARSVLSGGATPRYTTRTVTYYDTNGTTVLRTDTYTLMYDTDGDLISEVKNL